MKQLHSMSEFEAVKNQPLLIINVKSAKCSVCAPVAIKLENILTKYNCDGYSIYAEEVEEFSGQNLVFTVPTILIFTHGKEILRESRIIDFRKIEWFFQTYKR